MTDLNKKVMEKTEEMMDLVNDSMRFGCTFEESLPATNYFIVTVDGKDYQLKLELSINK